MTDEKKREIVESLRGLGCKTSFRTKQAAKEFRDSLYWTDSFPWNDDQRQILEMGIGTICREYVVQGTFGSGKTCCMLALFMRAVLQQLPPDQILLCAFNVCIKNELKRKIRAFGFKKKPRVRTFDSMIYEVCRAHDMEHLERPDYEGRREFIENLLLREDNASLYDGYKDVRLVLVDEVQDLDQKAYAFFDRFFPNARFYYFGDIFQCIQKEPRCSLLWKLLEPADDRRCHFMRQTPRVPTPILAQIQEALIHHYPEYRIPISNWYSTNPLQETAIRWRSIKNYNESFRHCLEFLQRHPPNECMILTFSSAITVRGSMGDLCRFRQFLMSHGITTNRNYKSMDADKVFLSTVNSSKGLERPYVFIALTFPLELAFANFSNDLVVNLISVGLSRCKHSVEFCVPAYPDRFSDVLRLYRDCPAPACDVTTTPARSLSQLPPIVERMESVHSVTEILRQSILSYGTRTNLRALARFVSNSFPEGARTKWSMRNEEEAGFMGILYEVLLTSTWTNRWPQLDTGGMTTILENPMYLHCRQKIQQRFQTIVQAFRRPFHADCFEALYQYTEFHILLSQKIRVRVHPDRKNEMAAVWRSLQQDIRRLTPQETPQKAQVNLCRSLMTGVADMLIESDPIVLYEIKTCSGSDWKEDAFTQAALYLSMTQQKRGRVRLVNPFRRELCEYQMAIPPSHEIHRRIDREMILWNLNCFLAKFDAASARLHSPLSLSHLVCACGDQYLEWLAPTKTRIGLFQTDEAYAHHQYRVVRFHHEDEIFRPFSPPENLRPWIMETIGYRLPPESTSAIDWEDPFSCCVLTALFIRCCYRLE